MHQRNVDGLESEQIFLTSGESGSGKTHVNKLALDFFAKDDIIGNKLKDISILLGGMGNAKTARNDNSSRFVSFCCKDWIGWISGLNCAVVFGTLQGKFLDIQVDFKGDALGGVLHTCKWEIFFRAFSIEWNETDNLIFFL